MSKPSMSLKIAPARLRSQLSDRSFVVDVLYVSKTDHHRRTTTHKRGFFDNRLCVTHPSCGKVWILYLIDVGSHFEGGCCQPMYI
jgi:hypothetical protein